jgi:hypothetical protein
MLWGLHAAGLGGIGAPGPGMYDKWAPALGAGPLALNAAALAPAPPLGSRSAAHRYRKAEAVAIYKRLNTSRALVLPERVDREDASLFAEAGQPDVLDVLAGIHEPGDGAEPPAAAAAAAGAAPTPLPGPPAAAPEAPLKQPADAAHAAPEAAKAGDAPAAPRQHAEKEAAATAAAAEQGQPDEWVYQDPQGMVQVGHARAHAALLDRTCSNMRASLLPVLVHEAAYRGLPCNIVGYEHKMH